MNSKIKNIIQVALIGSFVLILSLWSWIKPGPAYSERERRPLQEFPELSIETLKKGDKEGGFMADFQTYSTERFPLRDTFMSLKSMSDYYFFKRLDSNGYFLVDGNVGQILHPMDEKSFEWAVNRFQLLYDLCIKDKSNNVYVSVIPDKNAFIVDEYGYIGLDYERCYSFIKDNMSFAEYIDISKLLSLEDYYKTDTHWRQEQIRDVANLLATSMGVSISDDYTINELDVLYGGTFYDKSPISVDKDKLYYLTNDILDSCVVKYYDEMGKMAETTIYDLEKAHEKDPYELFLAGFNQSVLFIENPNATTDKELVVFRDSFGSSLVPLLASGYKHITVIDIRYIESQKIALFTKTGLIEPFDNKDVLFIYSTLVLNQSSQLK